MGKADKEVPAPLLLAAILCDYVIIDARTNRGSIINMLENISAPKYPARHPILSVFCQLTEGRGKIEVTIKLVDVQKEDVSLFEQTMPCEFTDIKQVVNLLFGIGGFVFPHPGEYRVQIFVGTELLGERRLICRKLNIPAGGKQNEKEPS